MTYSRLPVFYKQRDFYFYPAWTYAIPSMILKIPFSFLDAFLWTVLTYYVIGYTPEPERFVCRLLLLFVLHQVSISSFRLLATMLRNPSFAVSCSLFSMLVMFLFCGFIIPQRLVYKCYDRASTSDTAWTQLWCNLLLGIHRSTSRILDSFEYWIHLCINLAKVSRKISHNYITRKHIQTKRRLQFENIVSEKHVEYSCEFFASS